MFCVPAHENPLCREAQRVFVGYLLFGLTEQQVPDTDAHSDCCRRCGFGVLSNPVRSVCCGLSGRSVCYGPNVSPSSGSCSVVGRVVHSVLPLSCTSDRLARLGHTPHPQGIPPDFSVATDFETEVGVGLLFGRGGWLRSTATEKT